MRAAGAESEERIELRRRAEGFAALFLVQIFFGLFPFFVKLATDPAGGFDPRAIAVWRMLFGSLVLGGYAFLRLGRAMLPRRGDFARLALCALLGIVLNQVLALEGIARTSVVHAGLLMTLIPVFTYALATLVGQERLRGERIFGIALAMGGAATLVLWRAGPAQPGEDPLLGNVLIVANCLSYAGFLVLARPLLTRIAPLALIGWVFLLSLWTVPLVGAGVELLPEGLTARAWWGMAYTLVFPTAVAYLLNTLALARLPASTTAVFIYLQPIFAGASGVLWRGETVGPASIGAALLLFAGIWFVVRRRPPSRAPVRAAEEPRA